MSADAGSDSVQIRLEKMRIASWKFHAGHSVPVERVIDRSFLEKANISDQKRVPEAYFTAMNAAAAFGHRAPFAIDHRQVELQAKTVVDVVADERLRNEAVQVFGIRIGLIATVRL